jgi:hypothetical protein
MSRRTTLPGADELFRATDPSSGLAAATRERPTAAPPARSAELPEGGGREPSPPRRRPVARTDAASRAPSGRQRHDEKITVYVSAEELLDLEEARLALRGRHGIAVDRGRIVREALAVVLADLDAKGEASILVRRLGVR